MVVCEHRKETIDRADPMQARDVFRCRLCVKFSLKDSKWIRKDIRVYRANQPDVEIVIHQREEPKRVKATDETMDWVDQLARHEANP